MVATKLTSSINLKLPDTPFPKLPSGVRILGASMPNIEQGTLERRIGCITNVSAKSLIDLIFTMRESLPPRVKLEVGMYIPRDSNHNAHSVV